MFWLCRTRVVVLPNGGNDDSFSKRPINLCTQCCRLGRLTKNSLARWRLYPRKWRGNWWPSRISLISVSLLSVDTEILSTDHSLVLRFDSLDLWGKAPIRIPYMSGVSLGISPQSWSVHGWLTIHSLFNFTTVTPWLNQQLSNKKVSWHQVFTYLLWKWHICNLWLIYHLVI